MVKTREEQLGGITVLDEDGYGSVDASNAELKDVAGVNHEALASAPTTGADKGAFWVEDGSPTLPKFTDSDGTSITLGQGGSGSITPPSVDEDGYVAIANGGDLTYIEGNESEVLKWDGTSWVSGDPYAPGGNDQVLTSTVSITRYPKRITKFADGLYKIGDESIVGFNYFSAESPLSAPIPINYINSAGEMQTIEDPTGAGSAGFGPAVLIEDSITNNNFIFFHLGSPDPSAPFAANFGQITSLDPWVVTSLAPISTPAPGAFLSSVTDAVAPGNGYVYVTGADSGGGYSLMVLDASTGLFIQSYYNTTAPIDSVKVDLDDTKYGDGFGRVYIGSHYNGIARISLQDITTLEVGFSYPTGYVDQIAMDIDGSTNSMLIAVRNNGNGALAYVKTTLEPFLGIVDNVDVDGDGSFVLSDIAYDSDSGQSAMAYLLQAEVVDAFGTQQSYMAVVNESDLSIKSTNLDSASNGQVLFIPAPDFPVPSLFYPKIIIDDSDIYIGMCGGFNFEASPSEERVQPIDTVLKLDINSDLSSFERAFEEVSFKDVNVSLSEALAAGNTTSGNDIVISNGDRLTTADNASSFSDSLTINTGAVSGNNGSTGIMTVSSGDTGTSGADTGAVNVKSGNISGAGIDSGAVNIESGYALTSSGNIAINSGDSNIDSGGVTISTGSANNVGGGIVMQPGNAQNGPGGIVVVTAGFSNTSSAGNVLITAGSSNTGTGGGVQIKTNSGNDSTHQGIELETDDSNTATGPISLTTGRSQNASSGSVDITTGDSAGTFDVGNINLQAGEHDGSSSGDSGSININAGGIIGSNSGDAGSIAITAGTCDGLNSGDAGGITISAGDNLNNATGGNAGDVSIVAGNDLSASGNGGNLTLTAGSSANATSGSVQIFNDTVLSAAFTENTDFSSAPDGYVLTKQGTELVYAEVSSGGGGVDSIDTADTDVTYASILVNGGITPESGAAELSTPNISFFTNDSVALGNITNASSLASHSNSVVLGSNSFDLTSASGFSDAVLIGSSSMNSGSATSTRESVLIGSQLLESALSASESSIIGSDNFPSVSSANSQYVLGNFIGNSVTGNLDSNNIMIGKSIIPAIASFTGGNNIMMGFTTGADEGSNAHENSIAIGQRARLRGNDNVNIGERSGIGGQPSSNSVNGSGNTNVCIGINSGNYETTINGGNDNIFIGSQARGEGTLDDRISIGAQATTRGANAISIGANSLAEGTNAIAIGSASIAAERHLTVSVSNSDMKFVMFMGDDGNNPNYGRAALTYQTSTPDLTAQDGVFRIENEAGNQLGNSHIELYEGAQDYSVHIKNNYQGGSFSAFPYNCRLPAGSLVLTDDNTNGANPTPQVYYNCGDETDDDDWVAIGIQELFTDSISGQTPIPTSLDNNRRAIVGNATMINLTQSAVTTSGVTSILTLGTKFVRTKYIRNDGVNDLTLEHDAITGTTGSKIFTVDGVDLIIAANHVATLFYDEDADSGNGAWRVINYY